jgi:hypothetical protein
MWRLRTLKRQSSSELSPGALPATATGRETPESPPPDDYICLTQVCNLACLHDALTRKGRPANELSLDQIHHILVAVRGRFDADVSLE